ncbi:hypothetical protein H5410_057655 [Solanum commersonii]|uniref:Uncharacterized protein n=1 Tax=Solanum commersonii TaxID=4109 RepID=A0A9J5WNP9_SOLCO|nr:hypothetical protein H5410_057655 [Solanum commersonii]
MWLQSDGFTDMVKDWWNSYTEQGFGRAGETWSRLLNIELTARSEAEVNKPEIRIEADSNCRRRESITDDKGLIKEGIVDYYQKLYKETEAWRPHCT